MNKVILIGNLTRDPEAGTTPSGVNYCRFAIAVNRRFSRENNEVDYFNISTWRGLADNCARLLTKGRKVAVTGSIQIRNYEGQDGTRRTSVDVTADEVEFLGAPAGARADGDGAPAPAPSRRSDDITQLTPVSDELPF